MFQITHPPLFLALDVSTHTGWAISKGDKIIASGVRDFSGIKSGDKSGIIGERGYLFNKFLVELGRNFGLFDAFFFERVQFTNNRYRNDGGELYHGLMMIVHMFAYGLKIPAHGIHPSTLKKAFTGRGNAEKEDMCSRARELGWRGGQAGTALHHDEADAIAMLYVMARDHYQTNVGFEIPLRSQ